MKFSAIRLIQLFFFITFSISSYADIVSSKITTERNEVVLSFHWESETTIPTLFNVSFQSMNVKGQFFTLRNVTVDSRPEKNGILTTVRFLRHELVKNSTFYIEIVSGTERELSASRFILEIDQANSGELEVSVVSTFLN